MLLLSRSGRTTASTRAERLHDHGGRGDHEVRPSMTRPGLPCLGCSVRRCPAKWPIECVVLAAMTYNRLLYAEREARVYLVSCAVGEGGDHDGHPASLGTGRYSRRCARTRRYSCPVMASRLPGPPPEGLPRQAGY